jgi:hypothetical protein
VAGSVPQSWRRCDTHAGSHDDARDHIVCRTRKLTILAKRLMAGLFCSELVLLHG